MSPELLTSFFITHKRIVVFDTEFTTWEGAWARNWSGPNEHREVVQIAAQIIDLETGLVLDSFSCLVKPSINPVLSDYFINLTGITQTQVDVEGVSFYDAYTSFDTWTSGLPIFCYARSLGESADRGVFEENIRLYNLAVSLDKSRYDILTGLFQTVGVDTQKYSSGEMYQYFNVSLDGHVHNAMHDVDSLVASLFAVKKLNVVA
jgi:inhibitor of KinA sporulation pathway (predicted exonuclease)